MRPRMHSELSWFDLGMTPGEASRAARRLARAERAGGRRLEAALAAARDGLLRRTLDAPACREGVLVLLAVGLRERGLGHREVTACLGAWAPPDLARSASLQGATLARALWPGWGPERVAVARRRAAVAVFLAFAVWGALGVALIGRAGAAYQ